MTTEPEGGRQPIAAAGRTVPTWTLVAGAAGAAVAAFAATRDWFAVHVTDAAGAVVPLRGVSRDEVVADDRLSEQALAHPHDARTVGVFALAALAAWIVILAARRWPLTAVGASTAALTACLVALLDSPSGMHASGPWPWIALAGTLISLIAAVSARTRWRAARSAA